MIEFVFYGRGGQGAKTSGELLAEAALLEGKYVQAFPEYGPERRGAPTRAFVRIDKKEIRLHEPILNPNFTIIFDESLIKLVENKDTVAIINSRSEIKDFKENYVVDATQISYNIFGRPMPNTVLLGSLIKVSNVVKLDSLIKVVEQLFSKKYNQEIVNKNFELVRKGFELVRKV